MVKIKCLEVKLQNFVKIAHYCALRQERVKSYIGSVLTMVALNTKNTWR